MKTDDLVSVLAAGAAPVARAAALRKMTVPLMLGLVAAAAIMQLRFGVRPDIGVAIGASMFWMKVLVPMAIALASLVLLSRIGKPGARVGLAPLAIAAPIVLLWLMAIVALATAAAQDRPVLVLGSTWRSCTASILFIAVPAFAAALLALRQLAPTRLTLAGAAAGAFGGAAAAAIYALHCPETALPFMAVWYMAAIGVTVLAGALIGPRVLRW